MSENGDLKSFVRENHEMIADVLRHSEDAYARACALVLLQHGGTERDVEAVKDEVDRCA